VTTLAVIRGGERMANQADLRVCPRAVRFCYKKLRTTSLKAAIFDALRHLCRS